MAFDLLVSNLVHIIKVRWAILPPILMFLGRFVLDLSANTCQTRHVTLRPWLWPWKSRRLSLMRVFMFHLCTKFEVRRPSHSEDMTHFRSQQSALVGLVTLTFVLESGAHYCSWGEQSSYQFWSSLGRFVLDLSANTCQTHHVTWCGSSCCICVPSLKFVGLLVWKILDIYCVSITRPGDLDRWPFDLKIGSLVTRVMGFHPAKFGLPRPFCSVEARHRRTDNGGQFIMPPPLRERGHNEAMHEIELQYAKSMIRSAI